MLKSMIQRHGCCQPTFIQKNLNIPTPFTSIRRWSDNNTHMFITHHSPKKKGNESCAFCPAAQVSHKYSGYAVFVPKINAKLPHDPSNLVMSWGLVFASLVPTMNVTNHMTNQNQLAITLVRTRSHVVTFLWLESGSPKQASDWG